MRRLVTLALLLLATAAQAQTTTTRTDVLIASTRAVVGSTTAGAGPLRVVGLAGSSTGALLVVDASGDIGTAGTVNTSTTFSSTFVANGTAQLNGTSITLGNATSDTLTIGARLGSGLTWATDDTYDIGASGANRPRALYLSGGATIGGAATIGTTLGVTGNTTLTGDLAVNGNDLTSTGALTVRPTGNLVLDPTGDLVFGPDGVDILPASNAVYNLGALTTKYLTLHAAELWVETLVAQNTMATIGGRILVGPTTTLVSDLASGGSTMDVKHNEIASGDRVVLESSGKLEWLAVTSAASSCGTDCYRYSVTRNLDGSGANDWYAGDAVFNSGTTGDGFIDLYSVAGVLPGSTAGPTIVGNVRTGTTYSNLAPRWAIGNLNGLYGYSAATYGVAFGDPSATYLTMDATDGLQAYTGATKKLWLTAAGALALYDSATTYLQLYSGAINLVEGGVKRLSLASSGITVGPTSTSHLTIDATNGLQFKNGSGTVLGSLNSSTLTLGQPLTANNTGQIQIDSDSIDFRWRDNAGTTSTFAYIQKGASTAATFYVAGDAILNGDLRVDGGDIVDASGNLTITASDTGGTVIFSPGAGGSVRPSSNNLYALGTSSYVWSAVYATAYYAGTTAGVDGTCSAVTVTKGIVTGCTP